MGRKRTGALRNADGLRELLVAEWEASMARWRIPGHVYAYEEALKAGRPVVVTSTRLLSAFMFAGLPANRFGFGGVDYEKQFLLDGDELSEWHGPADGQVPIDE